MKTSAKEFGLAVKP